VFDTLPSLVGRKFKYSQVSHEHRAAELAAALQQLCMARVAYKVRHTSANGVPLGAEADERNLRFYTWTWGSCAPPAPESASIFDAKT